MFPYAQLSCIGYNNLQIQKYSIYIKITLDFFSELRPRNNPVDEPASITGMTDQVQNNITVIKSNQYDGSNKMLFKGK